MTGPDQQERPEMQPAWRLIATLGSAGLVAGFLLVFVFNWTQPTIQAYKARMQALAIEEVLGGPDRYDTLYVLDEVLTRDLPAGVAAEGLEAVYLGYRDERPVGFAVLGAKPGFQDVIRLIFGYNPTTSQVIGMKVLELKETPGLGDKVEKDQSFVSLFSEVATPLIGVKSGREAGVEGEIVMITGATISSRTVIAAINEALERIQPMLDRYTPERAQ
jgi:electron transport complex protein RnfG